MTSKNFSTTKQLFLSDSPFSDCVQTTKIECIPLKFCPLAMKLIKTKPYAPETIKFLQYSHCGFDGHEAKVWCTLFLQCKTPDSRDGICKNVMDCTAFMRFMEQVDRRDPVVKKYLKEFRCSTDQDPEVRICCPDEQKAVPSVPERTTTVSTFSTNDLHERFSSSFPDPDRGECGRESSENRIVGGTATYLDEYPWLALLKYVNRDKVEYACSGSLINERYVLTAAHCVDPSIIKSKNLGKLHSVILGEYDLRNRTDCIYQKYGEDCADQPQVFDVGTYVMHPNYKSEDMVNDIAIIRLDRKATFSDYVQPICLPPVNFRLKRNETFTISGWGRTENERRSPVKRKARLTYADSKSCERLFGARGINNRQICVGVGNGIDSCYGDSGGPLMLQLRTRSGLTTFAVGMVSYGYGQICGSFPGVYTYLPPFLDWIDKQMR